MATRHDPEARMWAQACELIADAERLHRQFFRLATRDDASWEPPIDVFEDDREIVVVVAMPGVAADRVDVLQADGAIVVRGTRPLPIEGGRHRLRQLEIPYGAFERRIALPPGRFEVGRPELVAGLPRAAAAQAAGAALMDTPAVPEPPRADALLAEGVARGTGGGGRAGRERRRGRSPRTR